MKSLEESLQEVRAVAVAESADPLPAGFPQQQILALSVVVVDLLERIEQLETFRKVGF